MAQNELTVRGERLASLAALLRGEIEALVAGPPLLSETAYTPSGTEHVVIQNGHICSGAKGSALAPIGPPILLAAESFIAAARLRDQVRGDVALIWRIPPEFDEQGNLYMRLCFERIHVQYGDADCDEEAAGLR